MANLHRKSFILIHLHLLLASLLLLISVAAAQFCDPSNQTLSIPSAFSWEPSIVQFTSSCTSGFDRPRVSPVNQSVYDWWYFDAVSTSGTESLVVIFFTASALGFPFDFVSLVDATSVVVFATFADGSSVLVPILAEGAEVSVHGDGASGRWAAGEATLTFVGTADLQRYDVTVDYPLYGISGTLELDATGPGHYACSPLGPGVDEHVLPHVGWVNVMPAATGTVDFVFPGQTLQFTGPGYHDKNWGDIPFGAAVKSWYWGHGTMGPLSVVWFDAIDAEGQESASGYVVDTSTGQAVGSTCSTLTVRPVGTTYPPTLSTADPTQFSIAMTLDDGRALNATVTLLATQIDIGTCARWTGRMEGTVGDDFLEGSALWEQFKLTL